MAREFRVQPNCYDIQTRDGTVYPARNGNVTVTDERHVREIERSHSGGVGYIEKAKTIFTNAEGKRCPGCTFHAFAFSDKCPRCGTALKEPANG